MGVELVIGDAVNVMRDIPTGTIGLVVADPPYASGATFSANRSQTTAQKYLNTGSSRQTLPSFPGDSRDQRSYFAWSTMWLSEAYRVLGDGCAAAVFTDWRQLPTVTDALQCAGFTWRGIATWDKTMGRP